jgi:ribosomal protein S15
LNFYLNKDELARGLKRSQWLSNPLPSEEPSNITSMEGGQEGEQDTVKSKDDEMLSSLQDLLSSPQRGKANADSEWSSQSDMLADITTDTTPEARKARLEAENANAEEALRRIASLSLGSSKDRLRVNKQRCIAVFGRHNTDQVLPPKSAPAVANGNELEKLPRVGVDTGSSEVQIAILTAKIRAVADFLETRGTQDKVNKRNLRLLVHRRAKLLKYLRRKERGGPRWQNLVEKLGLVEGTWKGEITM